MGKNSRVEYNPLLNRVNDLEKEIKEFKKNIDSLESENGELKNRQEALSDEILHINEQKLQAINEQDQPGFISKWWYGTAAEPKSPAESEAPASKPSVVEKKIEKKSISKPSKLSDKIRYLQSEKERQQSNISNLEKVNHQLETINDSLLENFIQNNMNLFGQDLPTKQSSWLGWLYGGSKEGLAKSEKDSNNSSHTDREEQKRSDVKERVNSK
jgi:predicted RNase H-like nuclease (RuvC/YqgF family)